MNQRVKTIFEEAQKLAPAEREELAELLWATIEPEAGIEKAWLEEAHRRWDEHKASGEDTIDALEAIEDARRQLKHSRGEA